MFSGGRVESIDHWKIYNNVPIDSYLDADQLSGLCADKSFYIDEEERFLHQKWYSKDKGNPSHYEMVLAKRMPHALDIRTARYAWEFLKKFSRNTDGSLSIAK